MRKIKRWKSTFGVLALALLLTVSLAPTAAFANEAAAAGGTTAGEAAAGTGITEKNQIEEPAVDEKTTAPNKVNTAVPSDDKKGTDISYGIFFINRTATITPEDANSDKTLGDMSKAFKGTDFGNEKAGNLVVKGDMSIDGDTTKDAAYDVEKDSTHDVKADLDVSAIHTSIEKSGSMLYGGADAAYVNHLETGLRSTFTFGSDLNGEFYIPADLGAAQAHYILSSADGAPLIYRINYANSTFAKNKVTILMDLDLTHMSAFNTTYDPFDKVLYGENGVKENFNHTDAEYGSTYDTSTFGNLRQLITSSAKKISLVLKGVLFHSATGSSTTTETDTETKTTTQGAVNGTLVGYMKADVGHTLKGKVSYVWGAMQNAEGRDVNAKEDKADKVMLTTQFTETTPKNNPVIPVTPDDPATPDNPVTPDDPATPDNPSDPSTSNKPGKPAKPSATEKPDHPSNPGTPQVRRQPEASKPAGHETTVRTASAGTVRKTAVVPQTGDTENVLLWTALMILAAGACGMTIVYRRKQK
nr:cell surface protein [uncultured Eubacterium sp.]